MNPINKKWLLTESQSSIIYNAVRLTDEAVKLLKDKFPPVHPNELYHHMTLNFGVKEFPQNLGETVELAVIGYKEDESAQAVVIDSQSSNKILHITLSTAEGVKPVYSNQMLQDGFEQIKPFKVTGTVSSFTKNGWVDG